MSDTNMTPQPMTDEVSTDFDQWFSDRYPDRDDRQSEFRMTSVRDLMREAWSIAFGAGCVHGSERALLSAQPAPSGEPVALPEFDMLDDAVIDDACTAGAIYRVDLMRAWESIRAQINTAPQAPSVPDGYALVPVEPTQEMISKADGLTCLDFQAIGEESAFTSDELRAIYRAMLSAAPQKEPTK